MVLSIYRRFSESTNFCSKERWLRPVAMMLKNQKIVNNRQPVLFHSHPGQQMPLVNILSLGEQILLCHGRVLYAVDAPVDYSLETRFYCLVVESSKQQMPLQRTVLGEQILLCYGRSLCAVDARADHSNLGEQKCCGAVHLQSVQPFGYLSLYRFTTSGSDNFTPSS